MLIKNSKNVSKIAPNFALTRLSFSVTSYSALIIFIPIRLMRKNIRLLLLLTAAVKLFANPENSAEFGLVRESTQTAPSVIRIPTVDVLH